MIHKQTVEQLQSGVKSLLAKSGYSFSDEDRALLEAILVELESISNSKKDLGLEDNLKYLSIVLRFLQFFGIEDISQLF